MRVVQSKMSISEILSCARRQESHCVFLSQGSQLVTDTKHSVSVSGYLYACIGTVLLVACAHFREEMPVHTCGFSL